jgi:hypothetical protein
MSTAPEAPGAGEGAATHLGAGGTITGRMVEMLARATWESEGRPVAEWSTTDPSTREVYRLMARTVLVWAAKQRITGGD